MPATWPAGLPQHFDGTSFTEARQQGALRSAMDAGPAKLRRRFTAVPVNIDGTMLVDATQAALLETFHRATLAEGTLAFEWIHPRTGGAVTMRFREPPALAFVSGPYWRASLRLEVIP